MKKILLLFALATPASAFGQEFEQNGFAIKVSSDGSASVRQNQGDTWFVDCRVDAMTDRRRCSISLNIRGGGGPFIYYGTAASPVAICVSRHDFPGRTAQVRIDARPAIRTDEDGCVTAANVLPGMLAGENWLSRRYEWPDDFPQDARSRLGGLKEAMDVVRRIRAGEFSR